MCVISNDEIQYPASYHEVEKDSNLLHHDEMMMIILVVASFAKRPRLSTHRQTMMVVTTCPARPHPPLRSRLCHEMRRPVRIDRTRTLIVKKFKSWMLQAFVPPRSTTQSFLFHIPDTQRGGIFCFQHCDA